MNERQRRWLGADRQMENFMRPIRSKAEAWLLREVYPSQEYQALVSKLQENDLDYTHQVLTHAAINLGIIELLRFDPTIKQRLEKVFEPFGTSPLFYGRYRKTLQVWDMTTSPTDLLKVMRGEEKRAFEDELQKNSQEVEWLRGLMEIQDLTLPLIINTYSKHEGLARQILTDDN